MLEFVDLRSDTVTRPSVRMREAMAAAEVGDDVYGEDPTVNRLEALAAEILGKEAALFVPTGTMGNTIAIKMHTRHGEEVICDSRSHIVDWELSMMAWFAGVIARTIPTRDGTLSWAQIAQAILRRGPHNAPTTLVVLENSHNMGGGSVYGVDVVDKICEGAHRHGLRVHFDGARIFNAAAALNVPVSRIARHADSVMFCLSKGLGAPVGSLVVGRKADIEEGRLYRKRLGGGMRQAGVLAAAGLIALEESPALLEHDHANAKAIADAVAQIPGLRLDPSTVRTNIVIFEIAELSIDSTAISGYLKANGILANGVGPRHMRMVTHRDVTAGDCRKAVETLGMAMESLTGEPARV